MLKSRDEPAKGKGGRRAHAQEMAGGWTPTGFGRRRHSVERQADFCGEGPRRWRRRHAAACPNEKALPKPSFKQADLPTDGAVGEPKLDPGCGVASGAGGHLEDVQSIQGQRSAHVTREKIWQYA
jgi:hypothetical protein